MSTTLKINVLRRFERYHRLPQVTTIRCKVMVINALYRFYKVTTNCVDKLLITHMTLYRILQAKTKTVL